MCSWAHFIKGHWVFGIEMKKKVGSFIHYNCNMLLFKANGFKE